VTRHWVADHPKWEVAAILSSRLGGVRVREFVELLDLVNYTLGEQLAMRWSRHGQTMCPDKFGQTREGDPWECEVLCGNDPYLWARIVDDLAVERDPEGKEKTTWKERPRASIKRIQPIEESPTKPSNQADSDV